jgi:hypothetical protein
LLKLSKLSASLTVKMLARAKATMIIVKRRKESALPRELARRRVSWQVLAVTTLAGM